LSDGLAAGGKVEDAVALVLLPPLVVPPRTCTRVRLVFLYDYLLSIICVGSCYFIYYFLFFTSILVYVVWFGLVCGEAEARSRMPLRLCFCRPSWCHRAPCARVRLGFLYYWLSIIYFRAGVGELTGLRAWASWVPSLPPVSPSR